MIKSEYNKYGYKGTIIGIYQITCRINNKKYIGSSTDILNRFSNHMNRETRLHPHREFYKDVMKYGYENFDFLTLEQCEKDKLVEREQFYFDKIKPEYNMFRPVENMFKCPKFREYQAMKVSEDKESHKRRKDLYNTPEYKELFRRIHLNRMRPVNMFNLKGDYIMSFQSLRDTARWLDENTKYKGKNKTSKVKAVCDNERPTAYGYRFQYSKKSVETISKESRFAIDKQIEAVGSLIDDMK